MAVTGNGSARGSRNRRGGTRAPQQAKASKPPRPSAEFADLSLQRLRALRTELTQLETKVSYWRRLVHARIDLVEAGESTAELDRLTRILADAPGTSRRVSHLTIMPPEDSEPLPELPALWRFRPTSAEQKESHLQDLHRVERILSAERRSLFDRIDAVHQELIARYRQDPSLALSLLPGERDKA